MTIGDKPSGLWWLNIRLLNPTAVSIKKNMINIMHKKATIFLFLDVQKKDIWKEYLFMVLCAQFSYRHYKLKGKALALEMFVLYLEEKLRIKYILK